MFWLCYFDITLFYLFTSCIVSSISWIIWYYPILAFRFVYCFFHQHRSFEISLHMICSDRCAFLFPHPTPFVSALIVWNLSSGLMFCITYTVINKTVIKRTLLSPYTDSATTFCSSLMACKQYNNQCLIELDLLFQHKNVT